MGDGYLPIDALLAYPVLIYSDRIHFEVIECFVCPLQTCNVSVWQLRKTANQLTAYLDSM